jgi:hypothetical protein
MHYERKEFTVVHDPTRTSNDDLLALVRSMSSEGDNNFVPSIGAKK